MQPALHYLKFFCMAIGLAFLTQCANSPEEQQPAEQEPVSTARLPVIFDTDANNELDDQHALAYLALNGDHFTVKGVTVNATHGGGEVGLHYEEARRILQLCRLEGTIPLYLGADGDFDEIKDHLEEENFDGHAAVDFIIEQAHMEREQPLILLPVGKLTNIALALKKDPSIAAKVRIVWLGSNYPKPGEYNQDNDIPSMNYVLSTNAPFEMVTVRFGEPSGTAAVTITQNRINETMPGKGPRIETPITGRHGGAYHNFGDYSVSLFEHIPYHNEARERALFDLAAVAIVKDPGWAQSRIHPCPVFRDSAWVEQPDNPRKITIWENFDREKIIADLYRTLDNYTMASTE